MGAIPGAADVHLPLLEIVSDGHVHGIAEATAAVAERLGVPDEALRAAGGQGRPAFGMNVRRAANGLRTAGLIENEEIGRFKITKEGKAVLASKPRRIDAAYLRRNCRPYRDHMDFLARNRKSLQRPPVPASTKKRSGMVAIIDVLGVKGSWKRGGAGAPGIHKRWNDMLRSTECMLRGGGLPGRAMTFSAFSDTMFITIEGKEYDRMLLAFGGIMWQAITHSIMEDVPVRGCVSCGEYFRSRDDLFTGPAVDEAAAYYSLPQWIGISAAPSANAVLSRAIPRPTHRNNRIYRRHDLPLRASVEQGAWAVNWPRQCDDDEEEGAMDEIVARIDERMDGTTDISAALKWRNTREFCNAVLTPWRRGGVESD